MDTMKLSQNVYSQIMNTVGSLPPECGGVLGAKEDGIITEFYFDEHGLSSANGYAPNVQMINNMLINDWMPRGILMVGIVHSHSNGNGVPSCGDISYGIRILDALDTVDRFYLPIVAEKENTMHLNGYVIMRDNEHGFVCRKIDCESI